MSYNVIIADDEYFILQRIKKIIPWEELNLVLAGEAQNGAEAIKLLQEHSADILLLDIKMPQMSGLEVAEYVHNHYPLTKIIILSGYNDFSYAQVAIRYGVADYLLKPVEASNLNATLEDCIKKIQLQQSHQRQIQQYYHYERRMQLSNVLAGSLQLQDMYLTYPELGQYPYTLYICLFMYDETAGSITRIISALREQDFDCEYMKETDYTYTLQVFLALPDASAVTNILKTFLESQETLNSTEPTEARASLEKEEGVYHFILAGEAFPVTQSWKMHHKKVYQRLDYRFFCPQSQVYQLSDLPGQHTTALQLSKLRQNILYFLNGRDSKGFRDYADKAFDDIRRLASPEYLRLMVTEFFMTYKISCYDMENLNDTVLPSVDLMLEEEYLLSDIKDRLTGYGLQIINETGAVPSDVILCKRITSYINTHYSEAELSVAGLAEVFQLNSCYMGSVFKRVNNQSILQYITQIRMEVSKPLLESGNYKISEIADMVGYSDAFYYSKSFKKMYGYSPKDYSLLTNQFKPSDRQ